jgi:hypothetical protein
MELYQFDNLTVTPNKEGSREFLKVSYPFRYGRFGEIKTRDHIFHFNLNGEIKRIRGRNPSWPHPAEWLKRTITDDWVYYSAGSYHDIYNFMGEHYVPCLSYPSNSIIGGNPFEDKAVISAIESWHALLTEIKGLISNTVPEDLKDFLTCVAKNDKAMLARRSHELHTLIGGQVSVLPPDTRHVDYEVIPIIIADGCLYNCGFCRVKSGQDFAPRTKENIMAQIKKMKAFYARDLHNYNAVFLGQHDALLAGREVVEYAAKNAYELLELEHAYLRGAGLFLFGSAESLVHSEERLFESLNSLPFSTYINIGLESADAETLALLKKPLTVEMVERAFTRMLEINTKYERIEITANFVFGDDLPPGHVQSLCALTREKLDHFYSKGAVYLSPLINGEARNRDTKKKMLTQFNRVKTLNRLATYIYLIQRL